MFFTFCILLVLILLSNSFYIGFIKNNNSMIMANKINRFSIEETLEFDDSYPTFNLKINRSLFGIKFYSYHYKPAFKKTSNYNEDNSYYYVKSVFTKEEALEYIKLNEYDFLISKINNV